MVITISLCLWKWSLLVCYEFCTLNRLLTAELMVNDWGLEHVHLRMEQLSVSYATFFARFGCSYVQIGTYICYSLFSIYLFSFFFGRKISGLKPWVCTIHQPSVIHLGT